MVSAEKVVLLLLLLLLEALAAWVSGAPEPETVKRDLVAHHPRLEYLHLGNFGPVSRLPSHPVFAPLGLTPQQAIGFMNVLLQNGLLSSNALRFPNGEFFGSPGHSFVPPVVDPYFLYLWFNYGRFLPYGLGPQGIYGSTGLPRPLPFGIFKHSDKN